MKTLSPAKQTSSTTKKKLKTSSNRKRTIGFKQNASNSNLSLYREQMSNASSCKENSGNLIASPNSSSYLASSGSKTKSLLLKPQAQTPFLRSTKNMPLKLH